MIVVTFVANDVIQVSLEPSDMETLNKAATASSVSREVFVRDVIDQGISTALEAETPAEDKTD